MQNGSTALAIPPRPLPEAPRFAEGDTPHIAALAEAIEAVGLGIVLLARDGFILFANGVARDLMRKGEGIRSSAGWLAAKSAELTSKLRNLLTRQTGEPDAATLILERGEGRQPLLFNVSALSRPGHASTNGERQACAVATIIDPERYAAASLSAFSELHGLTGAEARVLRAVIGGEGLVATAARLGVAEATARTHMKRIFEKTGTRRQTELLSVFFKATSPARLC
jgi:DNA-binding CsgD family transcriptional regulator